MVPPMTWVFGYGSLMWNPGFAFEEKVPAKLTGYHRWFSGISNNSRGTAENPGMMLGLMPGGDCVGAAYRVGEATRQAAIGHLASLQVSRAHVGLPPATSVPN